MRTQRNLAVETLERREVFTGMPGFEGLQIYDASDQINGSHGSGTLIGPSTVLRHEDINAPNAGLISSPLGWTAAGRHAARDQLMAMAAAGEVNFDHDGMSSFTFDGTT